MQRRLDAANPGWIEAHADVASRPDGDVDLEETAGFVVPPCERCGGVLKPHVVFFGENADRDAVRRCFEAVEQAPALLVLGSSLTVMSGLRFVRAAARQGTPVVIVNRGATRGDELATVKLEMGASEFLSGLLAGTGSAVALAGAADPR
jgi:NAD-dependent SIR2 family protein deacetylase